MVTFPFLKTPQAETFFDHPNENSCNFQSQRLYQTTFKVYMCVPTEGLEELSPSSGLLFKFLKQETTMIICFGSLKELFKEASFCVNMLNVLFCFQRTILMAFCFICSSSSLSSSLHQYLIKRRNTSLIA